MANYTPNLNLKKPTGNEYYDVVAEDNDAKDKIDLAVGNNTLDLIVKTKQIKDMQLRSFPKYGPIDLSKFTGLQHSVDFNLWRDPSDGKIKHDFAIDETGYEIRYISRIGSSGNDGKTKETAWGNLPNAITACEADSALSKIKIIFFGDNSRSNVKFIGNVSKKYIITSENPLGANQWVTAYTLHSGTVYKGACAYEVYGVAYTGKIDAKGLPMQLKKMTTLASCLTTPLSFYSDGVDIYVNNPATTTSNTLVIISDGLFQFTLTSTSAEVILRNMKLFQGSAAQGCFFTTDTGTKGKVITDHVDLYSFGLGDSSNGFSTDGIADTKLFNCRAFNIIRDGFNYHNTKTVNGKGKVFEYECYAENTGRDPATNNNNISTAHEGIHIIRIGTKGRKSKGPLIADINGCYSVNYDCEVYETGIISLSSPQNAAFYFDDIPATQAPTPNGKAWLINCAGGNPAEWGINSDASFKAINKIYVDNFKGSNIPADQILTAFNQ